jgi:hypothetical protein
MAQVRCRYVSISKVTSWGLNGRCSILGWIWILSSSGRADSI